MDQNDILSGFKTAYMDYTIQSNLAYRPEFVSNDYVHGRKVLTSIEQELSSCDEFKISVAFITLSGITPLLQILKELEEKGIPGKILTTDYLCFSEPKALEKLASLKNIELRMYKTQNTVGGFHTKGYIFKKEQLYRIIIGSSNMTQSAITVNREWNTKIVADQNGEMAHAILNEFSELWDDKEHTYGFADFIEQYKTDYYREKIIRDQQNQAVKERIIELDSFSLQPNKMQTAFVSRIMEMKDEKINKALLLSSTGTGKTYASAFAMREINPKRILFLVHREMIAKQALKSYKKSFWLLQNLWPDFRK